MCIQLPLSGSASIGPRSTGPMCALRSTSDSRKRHKGRPEVPVEGVLDPGAALRETSRDPDFGSSPRAWAPVADIGFVLATGSSFFFAEPHEVYTSVSVQVTPYEDGPATRAFPRTTSRPVSTSRRSELPASGSVPPDEDSANCVGIDLCPLPRAVRDCRFSPRQRVW